MEIEEGICMHQTSINNTQPERENGEKRLLKNIINLLYILLTKLLTVIRLTSDQNEDCNRFIF